MCNISLCLYIFAACPPKETSEYTTIHVHVVSKIKRADGLPNFKILLYRLTLRPKIPILLSVIHIVTLAISQ